MLGGWTRWRGAAIQARTGYRSLVPPAVALYYVFTQSFQVHIYCTKQPQLPSAIAPFSSKPSPRLLDLDTCTFHSPLNLGSGSNKTQLQPTKDPSIHLFTFYIPVPNLKMADVDMTDIPAPTKKAAGKAKAGGSEGGADGKKRFEVKKVTAHRRVLPQQVKDMLITP